MSAYTTSLAVSPRPNGQWQLISSLCWEIGYLGSGLVWTVPAGFTSDLASIPRFAWIIFDRGDSRYAKAAILHDHMLASSVDRLTAAAEFHAALRANRVSAWRRLAMFLAVALYSYR